MRTSRLASIPSDSLELLECLQSLHLERNHLTHLPPKAFSRNTNLFELLLTDNWISSIERTTLVGLHRLQYLGLAGNRLRWLKRGVFKHLSRLLHLDLSRNLLEHTGFFTGLSKLRSLELHNNRISLLHDRSFAGMTRLENVKLAANPIEEIKKFTFKRTPKIKFLSMNMSVVQRLHVRSFEGLHKLKNFALGEFSGSLMESLRGESKRHNESPYSSKMISFLHPSSPPLFFSATSLKSISLTNYTGHFRGFPKELFAHHFNFPQLSIFVVAMQCSCDQSWVAELVCLGAYVHGYCIDGQPISCYDQSFEDLRIFESIRWDKF